jgi:O-succinylbenzoic acid--CoA ligase
MTDRPEFFSCPVHLKARKNPDRVALMDGNVSLTYGELESRIAVFAERLRLLDIKENDRIGIISSNSIDYAVLIFTLYRINATAVLLNLRKTPDHWRYCLEASDCKLILIGSKQYDTAKGLGIPVHVIDGNRWSGVSHRGGEVSPIEVPDIVRTDSKSTIIFTSGSTGSPRGVVLTFGNHYYSALGSNTNLPLSDRDCWLAVLPFYHVGGLAILFRSMIAGSSVYILEEFDVSEISRLIDEEVITQISLVPTMLDRLIVERKSNDFPVSLKAILLGGAPMPESLIRMIIDRSMPVLTTYGMTETASQIATLSPDDLKVKFPPAGKPLSQCEVRINDPEGRPVDRGVPGEVAVRGKIVFKGYLNEKDSALDDNGWFQTGDFGYFDEEGYLVIEGRKDEMFVSGGENVHPREIEDIAGEFPGITEAAVTTVEDERWGRQPILFVSIAEGSFSGIDELRSDMENHLPPIMVPETLIVVNEFPRTTIGKIDKEKLKKNYIGH